MSREPIRASEHVEENYAVDTVPFRRLSLSETVEVVAVALC